LAPRLAGANRSAPDDAACFFDFNALAMFLYVVSRFFMIESAILDYAMDDAGDDAVNVTGTISRRGGAVSTKRISPDSMA
jgi:hypothetical protein